MKFNIPKQESKIDNGTCYKSNHHKHFKVFTWCFTWWQFNVINRRPYQFLILCNVNRKTLQQNKFISPIDAFIQNKVEDNSSMLGLSLTDLGSELTIYRWLVPGLNHWVLNLSWLLNTLDRTDLTGEKCVVHLTKVIKWTT